MATRLLVLSLCLLTGGCTTREEWIQSSLEGAAVACAWVLQDKTIRADAGAVAYCQRMLNDCREPQPVPR